jgi:hypothetical protein
MFKNNVSSQRSPNTLLAQECIGTIRGLQWWMVTEQVPEIWFVSQLTRMLARDLKCKSYIFLVIISGSRNEDVLTTRIFSIWSIYCQGPGSSVGIAAGYVLGGPGIESRWGARFFA